MDMQFFLIRFFFLFLLMYPQNSSDEFPEHKQCSKLAIWIPHKSRYFFALVGYLFHC